MKDIVHISLDQAGLAEVPQVDKHQHQNYAYSRRELLPEGLAKQCEIALYIVPPGKSPYPYHYHVKNEEAFYIISGEGILKTPAGDRPVKAGDFLFFPADPGGAHKLTNSSATEPLVYLDFDTDTDLEVAFYPDTGKMGVWGKGINRLYKTDEDVAYYEGE